jgi:hypothetical protein
MENIEKVLNLISQLTGNATQDVHLLAGIEKLYPAARKEFEALKAAGVEVTIEQVERITVTKPKSKRGGYRRKKPAFGPGNG